MGDINKFNIVGYVRNNMKTFEEQPFGEVDSAVFSWLSYIHIHEAFDNNFSPKGMPIRDMLKAEYFDEMFDKMWNPKETLDLLVAVVASPRFRNTRVRYYRNEIDPKVYLQFSAAVFSITDTCHYVAFRGTDWSITGWMEDLLLSLGNTAPAQKMAIQYLNSIGDALKGNIIIGGHSKGGNLAVYAATHCNKKIQDRILKIYSHDGPGILKPDLNYEPFLRVRDRIEKTIPEASYFGVLFESETEPKIIRSNSRSVLQHNLLFWVVEEDRFATGKASTRISSHTTDNMNAWIDSLSNEERMIFISALFTVVEDLGVESIEEIRDNLWKNMAMLLRSVNRLEKIQKKYVLNALRIGVFGSRLALKDVEEYGDISKEEIEIIFQSCDIDINEEFPLFIRGDEGEGNDEENTIEENTMKDDNTL